MTSIEELRGYPRRAKCYKKKDISPVGPGFGKGHSAEAFFLQFGQRLFLLYHFVPSYQVLAITRLLRGQGGREVEKRWMRDKTH